MPIIALSDEFTVNISDETGGTEPSVAGHEDGIYLISWEGVHVPPPFYSEVWGRTFDLLTPSSDEFVVNTVLSDDQFQVQVAARPDGSYVVAYVSGVEDNLLPAIASRIINSDGEKVGDEVFSYGFFPRNPDVTVFDDGAFVVTTKADVEGQATVHAADGSTIDNFNFGFFQDSRDTAVVAIDDDRYMIFWKGFFDGSDPSSPLGLYGQVYSLDGTSEDPVLLLEQSTGLRDPTTRLLANGTVLVVWINPDDSSSNDIAPSDVVGMIFDPHTMEVVKAPFIINQATESSQSLPEIAVLENGNFVVTWMDAGPATDDASGTAIRARLFYENGEAAGDAFLVNQGTDGFQMSPSVASIGDNRFVITWSDVDIGDPTLNSGDIEARLWDSSFVGTIHDDTLEGTAGAETLQGGPGDDTYKINAHVNVKENAGEGTDTVLTTLASYTLPRHVENLIHTGADFVSPGSESHIGVGNKSDNSVTGGSGGDVIYGLEGRDRLYGLAGADILDGGPGRDYLFGGLGEDVLTGGPGYDAFVINTALNGGIDRVTDFRPGYDSFRLENSNGIFSKLPTTGPLASSAFWTGSAAHDSTDRIIYNPATGALSYDPDGTGSAAPVQFAALMAGLTVTASDFIVW